MRMFRLLVPLVSLCCCPAVAFAAKRPSFHLDACAWAASDIVVVTEGLRIDGVVEVQETWKGDLKSGARLTIPELAAFAADDTRTISRGFSGQEADRPARVTCTHIVLFLIKKQDQGDAGAPGKTTWLPADGLWKQMKVSLVCIERGQGYVFAQLINPGPSELVPARMNECGLRCRVDEILEARAALSKALGLSAPAELARAAMPLLQARITYVQHMTMAALREGGSKCLPALRNVLTDETLLRFHAEALAGLAKTGGAAAGPELTAVVREELALWKKVGPSLKRGWWNGEALPWDDVERLRNHYSKGHAAVNGLKAVGFVESREAITAYRDLWRSLPQLREIGNDQIGEACAAALRALR